MGGCSAVNCSKRNDSTSKCRLFSFPTDPDRRKKWVQNMRRDSWTPTKHARLCEFHFEESQFEKNRQDGWQKLKPNAIPTLFNIPNPPPMINPPPRKSLYKNSDTNETCNSKVGVPAADEVQDLINSIGKNYYYENVLDHSVLDVADNSVLLLDMQATTRNQESVPNISESSGPLPESEANARVNQLIEEVEEWKDKCKKLAEMLVLVKTHSKQEIEKIEKEKQQVQEEILQFKNAYRGFLNESQMKKVEQGSVKQWSNEAIIKGLKLRFALSVAGYNYLLSTGYPSPSYSTLMRRIQDFKLEFGIFKVVLDLLRFKVETMDATDKFCVISYDEMQISPKLDYDQSTGKSHGRVTLDPVVRDDNWKPCQADLGSKIFIVVVKGLKNHWKQVIACHVTRSGFGKSASKETKDEMRKMLQEFILDCISAVENCGLRVVTLSSDMDSRNLGLWSSLGITVTPDGERCNSFVHNGHEIYAQPDICHVQTNLKSAMLRQTITLCPSYVEHNNLPTQNVEGRYVKILWEHEMSLKSETPLLHHLRREDIAPDTFQAMNVGAAVRFFSPKTKSALITAVEIGILEKDALTTAHFIGLMHEYFSLMTSKVRKTSITSRNCDSKYIFLNVIVDLFQNTKFGGGWKPLNYAVILSTLSFPDAFEFLIKNGFDFVMGHRFTQDATENIFSQIRRRFGQMPSARDALTGVRLISVSQYVSDIKRSSYMNDCDEYLLDFCQEKKRNNSMSKDLMSHLAKDISSDTTVSFTPSNVCTLSLDELSLKITDTLACNGTFYIAGSTTRAVRKHVCSDCSQFLSSNNLPTNNEFLESMKIYTRNANQGGLIEPCFETLHLALNCEYYFRMMKNDILKHGNANVIKDLIANIDICFPSCCDLKTKIVKHFFTVRSFCLKSFTENCKPLKNVYGTASAKRKKV